MQGGQIPIVINYISMAQIPPILKTHHRNRYRKYCIFVVGVCVDSLWNIVYFCQGVGWYDYNINNTKYTYNQQWISNNPTPTTPTPTPCLSIPTNNRYYPKLHNPKLPSSAGRPAVARPPNSPSTYTPPTKISSSPSPVGSVP